jgi:2-oxoglutarate dehydrogenase E1 component
LDDSHPEELKIENYKNLKDLDLNQEISLGMDNMKGFLAHDRSKTTLGEILKRLKETYTDKIGVQYSHIDNNHEKKNWIREKIETPTKYTFTKEEKKIILERLMYAELFEKFCATKFPTTKRFGLEGCESLIPGIKSSLDQFINLGSDSFM